MLLFNSSLVYASEHSCDKTVAPSTTIENVKLFVYEVEPKVFELGMLTGEQVKDIKRITYNSATSACDIWPIALEQGGDWGWHLVWVEEGAGVFYARMDGEAWVSSPKKRIATVPASQIEFKVTDQILELHWLDADGKHISRKSSDEGRYWD